MTTLFCPVCNESFPDEDYCPRHGDRLASRPHGNAAQSAAPQRDVDPIPQAEAGAREAVDSKTPEERRNEFLKKIGGVRKRGIPFGQPKSQAAPDDAILPPAVAERGWKISGPSGGDEGVVYWPVERERGRGRENGTYRVYLTGALTNEATYAALEERQIPGLARVEQHGTTQFFEARADYDLTSAPAAPTLQKQFTVTSIGEERAIWALRLLSSMLEQLEGAGVRPIVLEPAHLLCPDNRAFVLACPGAIAQTTEKSAYNPSYATSPLLSRYWAAPELANDQMLQDNAVVFSVGQVMAQALWSRPCSYSELHDSAIPFHSVKDEALTQALRGCLWPKGAGRWSLSTLFDFVNSGMRKPMPEVSPWASLQPGASSTAIAFAGATYWRLSELLREANKPANWGEATHNIAAILEWAEGTNWGSKAKLLRKELAAGRSEDWVLVALSRAIIPDTPPTWRELDLSDQAAVQSLVAFAQRALNGGDDDAAALKAFFAADLRGAFSYSTPA